MTKKEMGRPLKFPTPEKLQEAIEAYFSTTSLDKYTVTGLALVVGTKQTLADYEKREGYIDIVRTAKLHIENSYELSLRSPSSTGSIFALKNFGWKDKVDMEHSGGVKTIIDNIPHVEKYDKEYIQKMKRQIEDDSKAKD